ncbi:hypothetical protein B0O99DRAFT_690728 [Bisporella sp. PMI_857]|nr:hypothetical protein B0O99DRAFT_690728 [Bisporella sp. PMI_857]
MDFDPESAKNQQTEPLDASFNARSLISHHPYPYDSGVALPGFFLPFPSYTMYLNAATEQLVPSGFRASFLSGVRENWTGHESLGAASSQIQGLQLSANSEPDFDSAPQAGTPALYATPGQQNWHYKTAAHNTSPNELDLPQAGTVTHASSDTHSHYPTTKQQDWYNEPAARDNMPNELNFAWQDNTAHKPFMNGFNQDASTNLLHSNGTSEENHFSGNGSFDTQLSSVSSNTETNFSFNASFQASTCTYGTSSSLQEGSTYATIPSSSPETSFSSTSTTSPTPLPTNAPSPNSTRHPCPHPHCHSTFARQSDLKRHAKIHFPERHRKYHCWEPGCNRNGRKGFTRKDKWRDHVKGVHGLEEDESGFWVSSRMEEAGWNWDIEY